MKKVFIFTIIAFGWAACQSDVEQAPPAPTVEQISDTKVTLSDGSEIALPNEPGTGMTTIFMVRHAEKQGNDASASLTDAGKMRVNVLDSLLQHVELKGILSTTSNRTMETATPIANTHNLIVMNYAKDNFEALFPYLFEYEKGNKFLLVGHSDNLPVIIQEITGDTTQFTIPDTDYDDFFIVTAKGQGSGKAYRAAY